MSCLDATTVQGYVDGTLGTSERTSAAAHVDGCESCRRLIAALAMTTGPRSSAPETEADSPRAMRQSAPALGSTIDRYRLTEYLGHGGMGIVYRAHDPELKRDVAIKLLRARSATHDADVMQTRLLREAQAMAQVAHPNVIAIYDVGTWHGEVFLAMELATGQTLRGWCEQRTHAEIIAAYLAAGRGLAAAHAAGLVHRDFKPDNVLVGGDGRMRVTDFGLARSHTAAPDPITPPSRALVDLTATGTVMGTPGYMAPELYEGQPADPRTDQFAYCVALWEALYGTRPFGGKDEAEVAAAAMAGRVVDPPARRGGKPIESALRRGLDPRADARWPTMDALLAALAPRSRRVWRYVALATVVLIAGGGVLALTRSSGSEVIGHVTPGDAGIDAADPETARAAAEIEKLTASSSDALHAGNLAEARRLRAQIVARARASHSRRLLLDALSKQASMLDIAEAYPEEEGVLREARRLAEAIGDDKAKAAISIELAKALEHQGKRDEAADARALGTATASRPHADDETRAEALEAEADATKDIAAAMPKWDDALAIHDRLGHLIPRTLNRLKVGIALIQSNHYTRARAVLLEDLQTLDTKGDGSDDVATMTTTLLTVLAMAEVVMQRWSDVESHARRDIATSEKLHGKNDPDNATGYMNLGLARLGQGDAKGAQVAFDRALALDGERPESRGDIYKMIGLTEFALGHDHDAVHHTELGLAILEKHDLDKPKTLRLTLQLGQLLVWDHQDKRARSLIEKLLPKLEATGAALDIGDARFVLARVLPKTDRARARELAESARAELVEAGAAGSRHLIQVEAWLKDPDAPVPRLGPPD
jgi:serine/threonine protein kinase